MSGYLRDSQLRRQLEEKVKETTRTRQAAEDGLKTAQSIIDAARGIDAQTTEAEKVLAEANAAMGSKDYKLAVDKAAEAAERGQRLYRDRAQAIIDSSATLTDLAKGVGADVSEAASAVGKARDLLLSDKIPEAIDLAKRAWKRSEKVLSEHLSSSFSKVQALILSAKNLGKEVASIEDLLSRARTAMDGNNFQSALDFTREGLETITEDLTSTMAKETREAEDLLRTAEDLGADVTKATTFLERAKSDVAKLDFEKANNSVRQSKAETEKALQRSLEGKVADFSKFLADARSLGADPTAAQDLFTKAEAVIKAGNFREGGRLAKEGFQSLQEAQFQQVVKTIAASREKFGAAVSLGLDVKGPMAGLNSARQALQRNAYREALDWARKAEEGVDTAVGQVRQTQERLKDLHRSFADADAVGVDTKAARRSVDRARGAYHARDLDAVNRIIDESREELRRGEKEQVMRTIEDAQFVLTMGEQNGAELSGPSGLLKEAVAAAKANDHRTALGLVADARAKADVAIQAVVGDRIASLRKTLPHMGDDAPSLKAVLNRGEASLGAKDLEGAFNALDEGKRFVDGRTRAQAEGLVTALALTVQMGVDLGAAVGPEEALQKELSEALAQGRVADVLSARERVSLLLSTTSQTLLGLVKDRIAQAQNLKNDVDQMSDFYGRARMALGVQNYAEGLQNLKEAADRAGRATAMHRNAQNMLSGAAVLVAEARKRNVDVTKIVDTLVDAKKAFERLDYAKAMDLAAQARAETEKLTVIFTSAQKILANKERIELAARMGVDAPHLVEMATDAKEAMKAKKYEAAVRLATKSEEELTSLIRSRIEFVLKSASDIASSADGLSSAPVNDLAARARQALNEDDLASAADLALHVRTELEKLHKQGDEADDGLRKVQELAAEAETMNLPTPNTLEILEKADRARKAGRFEETLDLVAQAQAEVVAERDRGVAAMMKRFEESIQQAGRAGTDTRTAERLFERAREFYRAKKYRQAIVAALQSEAEAERIGLQQAMASQAVASLDRKLKALGRPAPRVERMVDESRTALSNADYILALDTSIKGADALADFRGALHLAQEVRLRAQAMRQTARVTGADEAKLDVFIREGDAAVEAGDAEAARASYEQSLQWGAGLIREKLEERLREAEQLVEVSKRLEVDATSVQSRLAEARTSLEAGDFASAFERIRQAKESGHQALGGRLSRSLQEAAENLAHARKHGTDAPRAEEMLREAEEQAARGQFESALDVVGKAVEHVESVKVVEKRFVDLTFKAETTIRNGKKFGADMRTAEGRLAEAMNLRRKNLPDAIRAAEEAYRMAWDAVETFAPNLKGSLEVAPAKLNESVDAILTLENVGKGLAKDVRVRILGDTEAEGLPVLPAVRAHASEEIRFKLRMTASGSVPLVFQLISHRVFDDKEYVQEMIAQIEVAGMAQERPKKIVASLEGRCPICKGSIKKGFKVTQCVCGREFHEMCASRVGRCPACFRPLGNPAE